jgi:transcriptional regulator with GAF, ATPase, and Fis domain
MAETLQQFELRELFARLGFITTSPLMMPVLRQARKAAEASDITVLVEGETGTGKQVIARAIHELDRKRRAAPFVTVHCSTISEALAESELFGHQRGAFSGAVSDRKGLFQAANHGTLLLDDVNDLPAQLQPKLLDVVQRGVVRAVGSDRESHVDVRIIAACNQPLEPLVREGRFRSDLYHRLNVVKLVLPPLRKRADDFAEVMLSLARRHATLYGPIETIDASLLALLAGKTFPGNIRELENAVQRMLFVKTSGSSLTVADWTAQAQAQVQAHSNAEDGTTADPYSQAADAMWKVIIQLGIPYSEAFQEIEKRVLSAAINTHGTTRREIAQKLHTSERTLYYKMRSHGLSHG